jgi:hypothetical protein
MNTHPEEADLALLAGGECGRVSRFFLQRHVRTCRECTERVARFELLREDLAQLPVPDVDWRSLEVEMKANIRLGLAAGECVRLVSPRRPWNPRLTVAFASLSFLVCAGLIMHGPGKRQAETAPVLESTGAGLELRDGASSITLINRPGSTTDQTVSAQGEIRARNVQGGSVTITNVSLE